MDDDTIVPELIPDIGGKTFLWVYQNKAEFVDFCVLEMDNTTGFFQVFQDYCMKKIKEEDENFKNNSR